jgi:hypothetical protein
VPTLEESPQAISDLDRPDRGREHKIRADPGCRAAGPLRGTGDEDERRLLGRRLVAHRRAEVEELHVRDRAGEDDDVGRLLAEPRERARAIIGVDDGLADAFERALP